MDIEHKTHTLALLNMSAPDEVVDAMPSVLSDFELDDKAHDANDNPNNPYH